jgi:hypothetical protein
MKASKQETTMKTTSKIVSVVSLILIFLLSACKANISRGADGSFDVETSVSQQELQDAISASIADPLIKEISVSLQSGSILVTGQRQRLNDAARTDTLTFRLELGISSGQLTATVSNAQLDGVPVEQNRVDHWNQTIANRIALLGQKCQNCSLRGVVVTPSAVTMTWNVAR